MNKIYRDYRPNQLMLLPPDLREWLPSDHLVYFINDVIDTLDLSALYTSYEKSNMGRPPYDPKMMLKVLVYAYTTGVFSSRRIQTQLCENIAFRVLAANNQPDFRRICEFRVRHIDILPDLFVQVLRLCKKAGLAKLGHVAIDGTKVKANASKHKAMSYKRLCEEEKQILDIVNSLMAKAKAIDQAEDRQHGEAHGDTLTGELAIQEKRLETIRKAKEELEQEAVEQAKEKTNDKDDDDTTHPSSKCKTVRGENKQVVPSPKAQRNFTDKESRIMKGSDKQFLQAYNCQAAVDADSQIIIAALVTNMAGDNPHLKPMVAQCIDNIEQVPSQVSADAGYFSERNVKYLQDKHIAPYIPPDKLQHRLRRLGERVKGSRPRDIAGKMRWKLQTKRGSLIYQKREQSIEPTFGQIKQGRGFRQFLLRGLRKVNAEWSLVCLGHNLLKLWKANCPA